MNILFSDKEYIFSHRVGGILIQNGKILLQKPKNDDYAIIGGHVNLFETTENALRREFKEELHTEIEIDNLMAIGEVFFPWGKKPCHQISLYYKYICRMKTHYRKTKLYRVLIVWIIRK